MRGGVTVTHEAHNLGTQVQILTPQPRKENNKPDVFTSGLLFSRGFARRRENYGSNLLCVSRRNEVTLRDRYLLLP